MWLYLYYIFLCSYLQEIKCIDLVFVTGYNSNRTDAIYFE